MSTKPIRYETSCDRDDCDRSVSFARRSVRTRTQFDPIPTANVSGLWFTGPTPADHHEDVCPEHAPISRSWGEWWEASG